jgi:hypothetical protein
VQQLGVALLSRYRDPPRTLDASLDASDALKAGALFAASSRVYQAASGARVVVQMQVIESRYTQTATTVQIKAHELVWTGSDIPDRPIILININMFNVNLLDLYQSEYGTPKTGQIITFRVADNVLVSSASVLHPAIDTDLWPEGVTLNLVVIGDVIGRGGNGGYMSNATGINGGNAIKARNPINVINSGIIAGGGGGGGASAAIYEDTAEGRVYTAANSGGAGAPFGVGGPESVFDGNIFAPPLFAAV